MAESSIIVILEKIYIFKILYIFKDYIKRVFFKIHYLQKIFKSFNFNQILLDFKEKFQATLTNIFRRPQDSEFLVEFFKRILKKKNFWQEIGKKFL